MPQTQWGVVASLSVWLAMLTTRHGVVVSVRGWLSGWFQLGAVWAARTMQIVCINNLMSI
jgi:hypothetical protein